MASLQYLECGPNFKTWPELKKITITIIWHPTPISTFDALSKWHEPDINQNLTPFFSYFFQYDFGTLNAATVCTLWPVTKNLYILWLLVQMANFWHQEVLTNVFIFGARTLENLYIVTKEQEVYLKFVGTAVETKSAPQLQMELFLSWIWENHKRIQDKSRTIQDLSWIISGFVLDYSRTGSSTYTRTHARNTRRLLC